MQPCSSATGWSYFPRTARRVAAVSLTPAGTTQLKSWIDANERHINTALNLLPTHQQQLVHNALPALDRLADLLDQTPVNE